MLSPKHEAFSTIAAVHGFRRSSYAPTTLVRVMAALLDAGPEGVRISTIMALTGSLRPVGNNIKLSLVNAGLATQRPKTKNQGNAHIIYATDKVSPVIAGYNAGFSELLSVGSRIGETTLHGLARANMANTRRVIDAMPSGHLPPHLWHTGTHPESALMHGLEGVAANLGALSTIRREIDFAIRACKATPGSS